MALIALLALIFLATVPDAGPHRGLFSPFLAFLSIFSRHERAGRGVYLSFLSQSAFFFRKALRVLTLMTILASWNPAWRAANIRSHADTSLRVN